MNKLVIEYPEFIPATANLSIDQFNREARFAMAVKLHEIGRFTSGQAAELAGCSRTYFLLNCNKFNAPSVNWDNDEIAREEKSIKELVR